MLSDSAFKTMDNLVGARIFMSDRISGHYYYNNTIVKHDKEGRFDGIYPGLGMYAQYYVYGKKFMIDQEGEYAFEEGKLYIKWSGSSLPNKLEFSIYDVAMIVSGSKYVKIHNIHFSNYGQYGIYESAGWSNRDYDSSNNIIMSK